MAEDTVHEFEKKAKYIRSSIVKKLFVKKEGTEDIKIRIAGDAVGEVMKYLDKKVEEGVQELIGKLPLISKGENKGKLKRITIQLSDFGIGKKEAEDDEPVVPPSTPAAPSQ